MNMSTHAMAVLRSELREFSDQGLVAVVHDAKRRCLLRGDWNGCPLSYAAGSAGSTSVDSQKRTENDFTDAWDKGLISADAVRMAAQDELAHRAPVWADAIDELAQAPDLVLA